MSPSAKDHPHAVAVDYTNHNKHRRTRRIRPIAGSLRFEESEWHKGGPQWILDAWDEEKNELRTFALNGFHGWAPPTP